VSLEVHVIDATGANVELGSVRLGTPGFATAAEQGTMAQGTIDIPDKGGVLRLAGLKRIWAYEPDSPADWQTFWIGFLGDRQIHRGDGELLIGSDRVITANVFDLNELLNDVIIKGAADATHGVRPAETDLVRVAWLLQATPSWFPTAGGVAEVHDLGFVATTGGVAMDACDYRGQTAQAVLQDCADKSGRNWFVYFDEVSDTYGLWYDKASSPNYVCTLSFSNVDGDADSDTIWWMNPGTPTQVQDPGKIVSGVRGVYTGGEVFRHASDIGLTTATDFYIREQTAPSANTKTAAKATVMADRLLRDNDEEEISASFSVLLPSTKVGLVRAGMRAACRFAFFDPPYREWNDWRILRLETAQDEPNLDWYNVKLDVTPIDILPCPDPTPSATWYPLGGSGTTSNPSPGDGNVMYWASGQACPQVPTPGHQGDWGFPTWGAGGVGTEDIAGDCMSNTVRVAVTGAGTMTIHTVAHGGHVCPMVAHIKVGTNMDYFPPVSGPAGTDLVVVIPVDVECDFYVDIRDSGTPHDCGASWGFTGVDWVAAP
jgi:hypothetical protein